LRVKLLLSCEHGGNLIPARYRQLFAGHEDLLASHRGWDLGARDWARALARLFDAPLIDSRISRLLIDLNRSRHHPALFSPLTRGLPEAERERIIAEHYLPHREKIESWIAQRIRRGGTVLHVAVHSFTPVLDGSERNAELGLLYDPARAGELRLCKAWQAALEAHDPALRVRRNYPYRGNADGLTTHLRRRFSAENYLGIELEISQGLLTRPRAELVRSIALALHAVTKVAIRSQKPGGR
jgi:predicted N-formylglutamate amidohydrolase